MVTRYRVLVGSVRSEITADEAREDWDSAPEDQRTGRRDGAFILWLTDERDCRVAGVVYRPITADAEPT